VISDGMPYFLIKGQGRGCKKLPLKLEIRVFLLCHLRCESANDVFLVTSRLGRQTHDQKVVSSTAGQVARYSDG